MDETHDGEWHEDVERSQEYYHIIIYLFFLKKIQIHDASGIVLEVVTSYIEGRRE